MLNKTQEVLTFDVHQTRGLHPLFIAGGWFWNNEKFTRNEADRAQSSAFRQRIEDAPRNYGVSLS